MKRKILSFAICICMVLACVVGFVGCGSKLSIEDANEEFNQLENIDVLMDAFDENGHNAENIALTSALMYLAGGGMALETFEEIEDGTIENTPTEIWQKVKGGYIYAAKTGETWNAMKYTVTRGKDFIKIEANDGTNVSSYKFSFDKNYIKAEYYGKESEVEMSGTFEWRKVNDKEYIQAYLKSGENQKLLQVQYTIKTEKDIEATTAFDTKIKYDVSSVIAYDVKMEDTITEAPKSMKSIKLNNFITAGEGVTSWKVA